MQHIEQRIVTAITAQRRNPDRVNIFINGDFRCGAAYEVVVGEKLRKGAVVSEGVLSRLITADARWMAKQAALSLLGFRPRSRGELVDRLRRKKYEPDAIEYALAEAARIGLVDDTAFSEAWARDRLRLKPRGARAIIAELIGKRVPAEVAARAVARVMQAEGADEDELCMDAALKYTRSKGSRAKEEDVIRTQRRLHAFLARRGFAGDAIRKAVRAALGR